MTDKKIISIEDRIPKLKEARKKKANRRLILYLTVFFLLILVILYLQSPLSHVKKIEVKGNKYVDSEQIVKESGLSTEVNIWNVKFEEIENNIKALDEIKSAKVRRILPNTVEIKIEEFIRVGYVRDNGSYFPVLENGQAIWSRPNDIPRGDAPILIGWENSTYLKEMTTQLALLHPGISYLISEIHWMPEEANPYKVRLFMNNGREVITSIRNFAEKMSAYPSIQQQIDSSQEGYINLDLGAYFVPYEYPENAEGESESEIER